MKALRRVSLIGFVLILCGSCFAIFRGSFLSYWSAAAWIFPTLIAPVTMLVVAEYARVACEQFIHYQRLREVFYVLELAYTAFRDTPSRLESPEIGDTS